MANLKYTREVTMHCPTSCGTRFRNMAISITAFALGLGLIALSSHAQSNNSKTDQKENTMTQSEATQRSSGQAAGKDAIRPFHVSIPEEALVDLRRRIAATRWPRPTTAGWGPDHIARAWVVLMKRLGHTQFVSQGGDVGAVVSDVMAGNGKVTLINSPSENYCRREAESKACWL